MVVNVFTFEKKFKKIQFYGILIPAGTIRTGILYHIFERKW